MARLIDADSGQELVEYLKRHLIVGDSEFLRGYLQGAEALADGLAKLPPVDAVEMVHGYWKYGTRAAVCSECGFERHLDDDYGAANACPNCCAKMDRKRRTDG